MILGLRVSKADMVLTWNPDAAVHSRQQQKTIAA
jgi:hypothetical protein